MPNRFARGFAGAVLVSALGFSQQTRTDADLFGAAAQENDPAKKLVLLDQWTAAYPQSSFQQQRNLQYISGYSMLAGNAAKAGASADAVSAGKSAAQAMLDRGDALFAPEMMPAGVDGVAWVAARQEFLHQGHVVLANIALNAKDYPAAEAELASLLEMNHTDATVSSQMGAAIVAERQPARYPAAIFHFARAVTASGPGALDADTRKSTEAYLENLYRNYHGSLEGLDEVKRASGEAWIPPAGWTIQSAALINQAQVDAQAKFAAEHPEVVLWRNVKERLAAVDGREYFAADVKGAQMPGLTGKVSSQPDSKTLVVVMDFVDPARPEIPEATLKLDGALTTRVATGTVVSFKGIPQAFTLDPFMLTMDVARKDLTGLPGSRPSR